MTTSSKPKPKRTKLGTQDLPTIPPVDEMKAWNMEILLRWIQQRDPNILEGDHLENFKKAYITGRVFLVADVDFYQTGGLPRGIGQALKILAGEVKGGKFIPWT